MRRPKRISRRELKAKIRELQGQLLASNAEISQQKYMYGRLFDRFTRLGTQTESLDSRGSIQMIEIKPIPFGQYAVLTDDFMYEEIPDVIKSQIVSDMLSQLLENGYVQFITGFDDYLRKTTLGAKIYVVPWEQMARGRTVTAMVRRKTDD